MLDILDQIDRLAGDAPRPQSTAWIAWSNGEQSISYYCHCCALRVVDYTGGEVCVPHPNDIPSDGVETCQVCGCLLSYSLTEIDSEIEHFEIYCTDTMTPDDWSAFPPVVKCAYGGSEWGRVAAFLERHGVNVER